jgi:AcrR family transcriptional regulator
VITVSSGLPAAQPGDARAASLRQHVAALGTDAAGDGAVDAVALGLVDAVLAGDVDAVRAALGALRSRRAAAPGPAAEGAAAAFAATAHWALERLPGEAETVARGTLAWRFLAALGEGAVGSAELRGVLGTDETQVSRAGARLLDAGLVLRRKTGRRVSWELSPRGRAALERGGGAAEGGSSAPAVEGPPRRPAGEPAAGRPGTDMAWWRDLVRSSWRAPAPGGGHASGDPVRDRILDAALELHNSHGVLATTWEQIATRAGVPVSAVDERFPTIDDLVPACGGLAFGQLRLPPPEEAAGLFADRDARERLVALVSTLFDLYDRAAPSLETLRRDSGRLAVLANARAAVEESIDALVAAALEPEQRAPETVRLVRALTDVPVWRALRVGGVDDSAAAEAIVAALATRVAA